MVDERHKTLRIAVAHDWLCGYRGGEAVLDRMLRLRDAGHEVTRLYVMFDDRRPLTPAIDRTSHARSMIGALPGADRARRWLLPSYPLAVWDLSRRLAADHRRAPIDLLISSSSAAVKGMRAPKGVPHLCYCHAPARYVWSQPEEYGRGSAVRRIGLAAFGPSFRAWDRATASRVTKFVANSAATAEAIARCYGREAEVVHPPVRTDWFTPDPGTEREDFWLVVSALEPYKRIDLAIRSAGLARARLVIAGDGSERGRLQSLAGPHVEFLGRVNDDHLRTLYRRARLLIFPQVEDFGIVAVEAQACGLPVVARRAGGAVESVIEGRTGAFFDDPTPEAVVAAASTCPQGHERWCRDNAERFSTARFDRALLGLVRSM